MCILAALVALTASTALAQDARPVVVTEVRGTITPVIADHLRDAIMVADDRGAQALLVELDTPGGLVASMRDIVQGFLNAPVPVIVHVAPRGADAGSAGTFITMAAHVAAMAPATTIGAATPVDVQGGEVGDKVVNNAAAYAEAVANARGRDVDFAVASVREGRSITAQQAVAEGVVDLMAADREDLLDAVDGIEVELPDDRLVTLATSGAAVEELPMSWTRQVLQRLADPNLAFLLLSLATLAILYEIANPGVGAGGVTGAVALVLGLYALSVLPVQFAGLALLVIAAILFAVEVVVPGIGVAAAGGTVALLLGGLFLFQRPTGVGIDLAVLLPTVVATAGLAVAIGVAAGRSRRLPRHGIAEDLRGRVVILQVDAAAGPRALVDGTWWRVRPADPDGVNALTDGAEVEVVGHENLDLLVTPRPAPRPDLPPTGRTRT